MYNLKKLTDIKVTKKAKEKFFFAFLGLFSPFLQWPPHPFNLKPPPVCTPERPRRLADILAGENCWWCSQSP